MNRWIVTNAYEGFHSGRAVAQRAWVVYAETPEAAAMAVAEDEREREMTLDVVRQDVGAGTGHVRVEVSAAAKVLG